jgi:hypothetical protein
MGTTIAEDKLDEYGRGPCNGCGELCHWDESLQDFQHDDRRAADCFLIRRVPTLMVDGERVTMVQARSLFRIPRDECFGCYLGDASPEMHDQCYLASL